MEYDNIEISYCPVLLHFKEPAGTSRGIMRYKESFLIRIVCRDNPSLVGYGEIPFFRGLSKENISSVHESLRSLCSVNSLDTLPKKISVSSVAFGLEQALKDFHNGSQGIIFDSPFVRGESSITINSLIWMGSFAVMEERIREKMAQGINCIKIKIGAIAWDEELTLLRTIRKIGGSDITIRVDANGAFHPEDCLIRIEQMARYGIHSIEQPIATGQIEQMARICSLSPIPVALDEELIGIPISEERDELLSFINPQFIILKPALCFGFSGAIDWIRRAERYEIGWWITSALESSVGLNAIAQFTGALDVSLPQGLGTGALYADNFASPLLLTGDNLRFEGPATAYYSQLKQLNWIV